LFCCGGFWKGLVRWWSWKKGREWRHDFCHAPSQLYSHIHLGQSEPAPTSASSRMDDKWSEKQFSVGSQFLNYHGG
jgi:hypothetical protein